MNSCLVAMQRGILADRCLLFWCAPGVSHSWLTTSLWRISPSFVGIFHRCRANVCGQGSTGVWNSGCTRRLEVRVQRHRSINISHGRLPAFKIWREYNFKWKTFRSIYFHMASHHTKLIWKFAPIQNSCYTVWECDLCMCTYVWVPPHLCHHISLSALQAEGSWESTWQGRRPLREGGSGLTCSHWTPTQYKGMSGDHWKTSVKKR